MKIIELKCIPFEETKKRTIEMYKLGYSPVQAVKEFEKAGVAVTYDSIQKIMYRYKKKNPDEAIPIDFGQDIIEEIDQPEEAHKTKNVIIQNHEPDTYAEDFGNAKTIVFGLMGDTQFGSKYAQITYLHQYYKMLAERGVCRVYHTGDITDGLKMRPGHEYELYLTSADELVADVAKNYPKIDGIVTSFITGNHDASIFKHVGYDIGRAIACERSDLNYLGRDAAVINIEDKFNIELRHPWDGTAYAISYKIQKMIEAMESDSKPNILAVGHYHKAEYIFYRNIHAFQTGCFQSQTPFTRGKGISTNLGGWIITVRFNDNGVASISPEFIPFYSCIKDDYKNWGLR